MKRALLIGAGSGRDIASAVIASGILGSEYDEVDLAGFLTPWAIHTFNGKVEKTINTISADNRKLMADGTDISHLFFEPVLHKSSFSNFTIGTIFLLSLQHGTEKLKDDLVALASERSYDMILAVDIGGDILAEEPDRKTVITPLVDLACLNILHALLIIAPTLLAVVSPGICGEIPGARLIDVFRKLEANKALLATLPIDRASASYRDFLSINKVINHTTGSYSHTAKMIQDCATTGADTSPFMKHIYRKSYQSIPNISASFAVDLHRKLVSNIYLLDIKQMSAAAKMETGLEYRNIIHGYTKAIAAGFCGTEIDTALVPQTLGETDWSDNILMMSACCHMKPEERGKVIAWGCEKILQSQAGTTGFIRDHDISLLPKNTSLKLSSIHYKCLYVVCQEDQKGSTPILQTHNPSLEHMT